MSTSERDPFSFETVSFDVPRAGSSSVETFGAPATAQAKQYDPASQGSGLPDLGMLSKLANEFFRGGFDNAPVGGLPGLPAEQSANQVVDPSPYLAAIASPLHPASFEPSTSFGPSTSVQPRAELAGYEAARAPEDRGGGLYFMPEAEQRAVMRDAMDVRAPNANPPGVPAPYGASSQQYGAPLAYGAQPSAHGQSNGSASPSRAPAYDITSFAGAPTTLGGRMFDVASIRRDFPILSEVVNGHPLVWLDNAATTQKPQAVIDRLAHYYAHENSNIHRAAHSLAARSTDAYEGAREKVRRFLNAPSAQDIVFTRGTTEAINLVAQSFGRRHLREGDEIVITWLEHHSNIVPWQQLAQQTGAKLKVAPVDATGQVRLDEYERLFTPRTRLVSFTHVSNALGTVTPAREMVAIAHRYGARVLVDGAQAVSHMKVDVQSLDADFYVFSGHKVFGPTGIGALYGKSEILEAMPPWQGGGNMIADVTFDKTVYNPAPFKFEAGTGNIADAVGLGAALDYLERIGMDNVARHEHELLVYGTQKLLEIDGIRLIGTAAEKAGVMSFVIPGLPSEQVGAALAQEGIAVRSGHHCAQPILRHFGLETTVRPSLALYNDTSDIDALISVLKRLRSNRLV
ncbi:MAG: family 2A encapsulin nanocompartment cargo protein cysteine desulfurase [Polyangiales bacterium]